MTSTPRRRGRVVASRRIASAAFLTAGCFGLIAVAWSILVVTRGGSWWGPLHAFLAGTVLLAISGATQLFTITRAAASPPRASLVNSQRFAVAVGVGLVLFGMAIGSPWTTAAGAVLVVAGLGMLAWALVGAVRRSLTKRFDLSTRFYLLAVSAGIVGVALGGLMGSGLAGTWYGRLRLVHSHLNLIGLVGLTILGTLPAILPTFAHQKVVSGREAQLGWWLAAGSVILIAAGLVVGEEAVGLGSVLAGISLLVVLAGVIGRLGRRGLEGRLAYHQVGIGCGWLAVWAILDGGRLLAGSTAGRFGAWTGVVIVAGVGQVLLGSLAYLLPVLAGPAPRLPRNLDRMNGRMLLPLTFANLAGAGFAAGFVQLAAAATGLWVLDFAYRLSRIEWRARESGAMS